MSMSGWPGPSVRGCMSSGRFVGMSPNIFNDPGANPRAWTYVGQALTAWEARGDGDQQLLAATLSGLLNDRWAGAFLRMYSGGGYTAAAGRHPPGLPDAASVGAGLGAWPQARSGACQPRCPETLPATPGTL